LRRLHVSHARVILTRFSFLAMDGTLSCSVALNPAVVAAVGLEPTTTRL